MKTRIEDKFSQYEAFLATGVVPPFAACTEHSANKCAAGKWRVRFDDEDDSDAEWQAIEETCKEVGLAEHDIEELMSQLRAIPSGSPSSSHQADGGHFSKAPAFSQSLHLPSRHFSKDPVFSQSLPSRLKPSSEYADRAGASTTAVPLS